MREQVTQVLPWFKEITKIATELEIDLNETSHRNKTKWKNNLDEKIRSWIMKTYKEEIEKNERYKGNIELVSDNVVLSISLGMFYALQRFR